MLVGEYTITVQDPNGNHLVDLVQTTTTGHPVEGHELLLSGQLYVVERVRHEQDLDGGSSSRVYSHARVFVRAVGRPNTPEPDEEPVTGRVLPLVLPNRGQVQSCVLPPSLIAVFVACGYRALATQWRARRRIRARRTRTGRGCMWAVDDLNVAECWRLSREAKRHYVALFHAMLDGRFPDTITSTLSRSANVLTLARASREAPPGLRSVSAG